MAGHTSIRLLLPALLLALPPGFMLAQQTPPQNSPVPSATEQPAVPAASFVPPERAPNPPRVTCHGNQLTIAADNATMGSVIAAVNPCIGVAIEMPDGFAAERTYVQLGPAPTREVLDALLSSTEFDYVIRSSNSAPEKILAILVMPRAEDASEAKDSGAALAANHTMTPARRAWLQSRSAVRPAAPSVDGEPFRAGEAEGATGGASDETAGVPPLPKPAFLTENAIDPNNPPRSTEEVAAAPSAAAPDTASAPVTAAVSEAAPASTAAAAGQNTAPADDLHNRISDMQQMFEQRKKMTTDPATPPSPN